MKKPSKKQAKTKTHGGAWVVTPALLADARASVVLEALETQPLNPEEAGDIAAAAGFAFSAARSCDLVLMALSKRGSLRQARWLLRCALARIEAAMKPWEIKAEIRVEPKAYAKELRRVRRRDTRRKKR